MYVCVEVHNNRQKNYKLQIFRCMFVFISVRTRIFFFAVSAFRLNFWLAVFVMKERAVDFPSGHIDLCHGLVIINRGLSACLSLMLL